MKGLQTFRKRLKLLYYFKNKTFTNGILFIQEPHYTKENEIQWKDKFDCDLYFAHGKSNSCGVIISFSGNKTYTVKKRLRDENGRILILEKLIDGTEFVLINLYSANTKCKQVQTFNELNTLVSNLKLK